MNATILLVDDERDLAELWREYLVSQGHTVIVAHNVRAAIAAVAAREPDVVVVDYHLPDGTAADVIAKLDERTPVIVCSGRGDDLPGAIGRDGLAVLGKPFRLDQFEEAIRGAVNRRPSSL